MLNTISTPCPMPCKPELSSGRPAPFPTRTVAMLFTDIVGSTALTRRLGDQAAHAVLRQHDAIIRDALSLHGGEEIKHTGDGVFAAFPSSKQAVACAVSIQRGMGLMTAAAESVSVRIGINIGEAIADGGDLFGAAVQLASRICAMASGRQILVSGAVRQTAGREGFAFSGEGTARPRGIGETVALYSVRWDGDQNA